MPRIETQPFADEHLDAAAYLLADRHRRQRATEPLLPERFEDPAAARVEVEAVWRKNGAAGVVAIDGRRVAGYLIGAPRDDKVWGPNMWIELAGHAAREAEVVRDLYADAAQSWVDRGRTSHHVLAPASDAELDRGRTSHHVLAPASDAELVQAWFRLSFGQQHAQGIREVPAAVDAPVPDGVTVRRAGPDDVEACVRIDVVLPEYQQRSPVFARTPRPTDEELRADWAEGLGDGSSACFLAERDGDAVGSAFVAPIEQSGMHSGLARPGGACILGFAATVPDVRGSGVGVALTSAVFAWARDAGYRTIVVDWRVTNLLSSRFWPRRGFRTTFLRLYRAIP